MERIAFGTLAALVVAQGAYTLKLQRNMRALAERLDQAAIVEPMGSAAPAASVLHRGAPPAPPTIPRLTTTSTPVPVLEALGTPEARQKIQEVLGAIKEEKRREKLLKSVDRREKTEQRLKELIGPELALTAEENARATEVLTRAITTRRHAVEELQSGARSRAEARSEIDGASKQADQALEKLLGEKRLQSYKDLRKRAASDALAAAARP
jgi:hypothetical protein